MLQRLSPTSIISDFLDTFREYNSGKLRNGEVFGFFLLPLAVALILRYVGVNLDGSVINSLITSLSIFAALLFNLLLLAYDALAKQESNTKGAKLTIDYLHQIYGNISFSILISIVCIAILVILLLFPQASGKSLWTLAPYYFASLFLCTLFMILKRVHILIDEEFKSKKKEIQKDRAVATDVIESSATEQTIVEEDHTVS